MTASQHETGQHETGHDRTDQAAGAGRRTPDPLNRQPGQTPSSTATGGLERRIAGATLRARLALGWENLWPRLIWPIGVVLLFVAVSWFGVWLVAPEWLRIAGLVAFGLAFLASLAAFRGFALPARERALERVESHSGYTHRPLTTFEDTLPEESDGFARALWAAHRERIVTSIDRLDAGLPKPGLPRRDRYALRVALGLLLFVGWFAGTGERYERIAAAFAGPRAPDPVESRLDAWVTPPNYTGRAPIFLTGEPRPALEKDGTIRVPQGSVVVVRAPAPVPGSRVAALTVEAVPIGGKAEVVKASEAKPDENRPTLVSVGGASPSDYEVVLSKAATVSVKRGDRVSAEWRFSVDPDAVPTIRLVAKPEVQQSGTLKLAYEITDDYGVVGADAKFEAGAETFKTTSTAKDVRPLVGAPDFPLSLPQGRQKSGQAQTFRDVLSHPWAGATVRMTLAARDEAGQEGRSETVDVKLPAKPFSKPLARALVEQRRVLALDANRAPRVTDAIDALLIAPEHFYDDASVFLGMRMVHKGLIKAKTDDDLRAMLDLMWAVALGIEDGDLSMAEKALRDAQEALRNALENNASEQEIAKLTQQLREAMDRYLRELAEQSRQNPMARQQQPMDPNQRTVRRQDLDKMLRQIEDLAKTGSRDAAKQLLSQLQQMLENLQAGRPQQGQQGQQSEMSENLDKLGEMIQRQQQLMDRTHRMDPRNPDRRSQQSRRGQNRDEPPMTPEEYAQALKELREQQKQLQEQLQALRDKMQKNGQGQQQAGRGQQKKPGQQPGQQPGGEQGDGDGDPLGEAGDAMGDAGDSLGQGQPGDAAGSQGRALDALRQGARQLAEQMMQQMGQGQGQGQPGGPEGDMGYNDDPLGRPRRNEGPDFNNTVKVPDEIDVQRARRILEDIRRRLGENFRPQLELDYLERLLRSE